MREVILELSEVHLYDSATESSVISSLFVVWIIFEMKGEVRMELYISGFIMACFIVKGCRLYGGKGAYFI